MKFGKILIVVGLIAVGILSQNFQAQAGNPPGGDGPNIVGNEYWGVLMIACTSNEIYLRVKRVVDCQVETDSLIETNISLTLCPINDPNGPVGFFAGYNGVIFGEPGVPIVTKVKNYHKKTSTDPGQGKYIGDIYSWDVQIRFCTNCE